MHVSKPNRRRNEDHRLERWVVRTSREWRAGLLPREVYYTDFDKIPFTTQSQASAFMKVLQKRLNAGAGGAEDKTFNDAFEVWCQIFSDKVGDNLAKQTHMQNEISKARRYLLTLTLRGVPIGDVKLVNISHDLLYDELVANRGQLYDTLSAPASRAKLLSILKKMFRLAVAKKWIPHNPADELALAADDEPFDPEAARKDKDTYFRLDRDMPALLEAVSIICPDLMNAFQFLRRTGVRARELKALSVDQLERGETLCEVTIDRAFKTKDVCVGGRKNGKLLTTFIGGDFATELLEQAMSHRATEIKMENRTEKVRLVFAQPNGTPLNIASLLYAWRQAQFATAGYLFMRVTNAGGSTSRRYSVARLDKPIVEFTHDEWKQLVGGQKGRPKGEPRELPQFASLEEAAEHAGIKIFGLHDFRHLYASKLASAGIDLGECARRIGDTEEVFKKHYLHFFPTDTASNQRVLDIIN